MRPACRQNDRLRHLIRQLQRLRFGRRSEKLDPDQLNLALEDVEQAVAETEAQQEKADPALKRARAETRRAGRGSLPEHLPRVEIVIEPETTACRCCGGAMQVIGEDRSSRLDVIPAQYRVLITRRPKYACRTCQEDLDPGRCRRGSAGPVLHLIPTARGNDRLPGISCGRRSVIFRQPASAGEERCRRRWDCARIGTPNGFVRRPGKRKMPTRRVGCWRLRQPTKAKTGPRQPRLAPWPLSDCAIGCAASMPQGRTGLIDRKPAGAVRRLTAEQEAELTALIEAGPDVERDGVVRWRCVDLRQLILSRWNIAYHERTIGKLLRRLGFRHISARPRHLGQDPAAIDEFKKTLPSVSARSGQRSIPRRR